MNQFDLDPKLVKQPVFSAVLAVPQRPDPYLHHNMYMLQLDAAGILPKISVPREELEKRQKKEQQKKDLQGDGPWSAGYKEFQAPIKESYFGLV